MRVFGFKTKCTARRGSFNEQQRRIELLGIEVAQLKMAVAILLSH